MDLENPVEMLSVRLIKHGKIVWCLNKGENDVHRFLNMYNRFFNQVQCSDLIALSKEMKSQFNVYAFEGKSQLLKSQVAKI